MESWMPDFMQWLANDINANTSLVTAAAENLSSTLSNAYYQFYERCGAGIQPELGCHQPDREKRHIWCKRSDEVGVECHHDQHKHILE